MTTLNSVISILLATIIGFFIFSVIGNNVVTVQAAALIALFIATGLTLLINNLLKRIGRSKSSRHQHPATPIEGPKRYGVIKWFNTKKQFGFITSEDGGDIFVHKRFINGDKRQRIRDGMKVEFSVSETAKGLQAEDVNLLD